MPYCRNCGAKLRDDAKYCYHCGTKVIPLTGTYEVPRVARRNYLLPVLILIGVVICALVFSAIAFVPFSPVNFNQTNELSQPNVNQLNLNFQADTADVNVILTNSTGETLLMNVSATGSTNTLGTANAITVSFANSTVNNVLTVNASISDSLPFFDDVQVTCNIYIDPNVTMDLKVGSDVGQISIDAETPTAIKNLDLSTTTGSTQATLGKNVTVAGDVSITTTTGSVSLLMNQPSISGNITISLQSTTGSVNLNTTELKELSGNIQVNAATTTGSINLNMVINGDVGAKITYSTNIGSTSLQDTQGFSGSKSPIQSSNYPADSNILVNLNTNVGGITIEAVYEAIKI